MMDGNPIDMRRKQSLIYWVSFTIVPCLIIKRLNSKKEPKQKEQTLLKSVCPKVITILAKK